MDAPGVAFFSALPHSAVMGFFLHTSVDAPRTAAVFRHRVLGRIFHQYIGIELWLGHSR